MCPTTCSCSLTIETAITSFSFVVSIFKNKNYPTNGHQESLYSWKPRTNETISVDWMPVAWMPVAIVYALYTCVHTCNIISCVGVLQQLSVKSTELKMTEEGRKKRNDLSLKMKYEVIKAAEREPNVGTRKLADTFKCGKTQIQTIIKNKQHIKDLYVSNASSSLTQYKKRSRTSEYADINEALYNWYLPDCHQKEHLPRWKDIDGERYGDWAATWSRRFQGIKRMAN